MTGVLMKRDTETETQEGEHHVMMETEIRLINIQAKDCQRPPEVWKRQPQIFPFRFQREHGPADT